VSTGLSHPKKLSWQARYWRLRGRLGAPERIEDQLPKAGRCKRCGRLLTDPVSVERGVGPECIKKGE
jgi:hypothetical protein